MTHDGLNLFPAHFGLGAQNADIVPAYGQGFGGKKERPYTKEPDAVLASGDGDNIL